MKVGRLYFLKDEYLTEYNLSYNKGIGHDRPFFCCLEDRYVPGMYWMIPLSTQVDHYEELYERQIRKFGSCDGIDFAYVNNKKNVFKIKSAFPATDQQVKNIYINKMNGKDQKLKIDDQNRMKYKLRSLITLQNKGYNIFFNDVCEMRKKLSVDLMSQKQLSNPYLNTSFQEQNDSIDPIEEVDVIDDIAIKL